MVILEFYNWVLLFLHFHVFMLFAPFFFHREVFLFSGLCTMITLLWRSHATIFPHFFRIIFLTILNYVQCLSKNQSVGDFGTRLLNTVFVRFLKNCIYPTVTDANPDVSLEAGTAIARVWNSFYHVPGLLHSHPVFQATCPYSPLEWQQVSVAKTGLGCGVQQWSPCWQPWQLQSWSRDTPSCSTPCPCCLCLLQQFNFNILPTFFLQWKHVQTAELAHSLCQWQMLLWRQREHVVWLSLGRQKWKRVHFLAFCSWCCNHNHQAESKGLKNWWPAVADFFLFTK